MQKRLPLLAFAAAAIACQEISAADPRAEAHWYGRSFFLLHLDHHTTDTMEVGRDADPAETVRLINLVKPDVIQIHAKGNPGWTTYPTTIGHTPPKLARDVMQVWAEAARSNHYVFSAYYNIGRDREIMRRHPAWNRVQANGEPYDNMLCYHSGVAEQYLWPMIDEIMDRYRPGGFWFDGSCFTVMNCYCGKCRERFRREHQLDAPANPQQAGWAAYKAMQRQIYREFCAQTADRVKKRDPNCLVAINWAFSLRMPEDPPAGVDYFTGDHGTLVDDLAPDAIWYDSQQLPFDLMTTVFYHGAHGAQLKPRWQLEQEMAIIIAHGGRFFAWDNPTPGSGLLAPRYEMMARVVTPFLRARQTYCLGSRALPDVSLFHGAAAHYAHSAASPAAFPRQNPPLLAACEALRRLHLSPEMLSDRRLEQGNIRGRLLVLEDTPVLTDANRRALRRYVENGGRVLLTGKAVSAAQLTDAQDPAAPGLSRHALGKGEVCCSLEPLVASAANQGNPAATPAQLLHQVLPPAERLLSTDAPETVELLLRETDGAKVLHAVNIAPGRRERDPQALGFLNLHIKELPPAPACRASLRLPQRPLSVTLQPQGKAITDWTWRDEQLDLALPSFETHQMVVIAVSGERP
jgi:hypothetical protein